MENKDRNKQKEEQIEKAYQEFMVKLSEARKRFNVKIDKILNDIDKRKIEKIKAEIRK
jgi:anti-sigma28 factor (negative regulator of flagellin synthesis)